LIKFNPILNLGCYVVIITLFSMCNAGDLDFDNIETPNHKGSFEIAIGETTYTVDSLISDLEDPNIVITTDNAGLISVAYYDTTVFKDIASIIELADISNPGVISPVSADFGPSPGNQEVVIDPIELSFDYDAPNNEELD